MNQQKPTIFVVPHSHIDVEWYWTVTTSLEWSGDIFRRVLALLKTDADYCFTQDQIFLLKHFWDSLDKPEQTFFHRMVSTGRLELAGGMYVQPELAEPAGECLIRQILVGQAWLQTTFGLLSRCGWFIDSFEQIPQLPQILAKSGFNSVVFFRDIPPQGLNQSMPADFIWQSPDGTRLRAHWMPGGYSHNAAQTRLLMEHTRSRSVFFPFGSDVYRPEKGTSAIRQEVGNLLESLDIEHGEIDITTASRFFNATAVEGGNFPVLDWDFNPPYFGQDLRGTYDNRIEQKKLNRSAEQALLNAEKLAALAYLNDRSYPKQALDALWEKLLFSQIHDTMGGSSSDSVFLAAMERLATVLDQSNRLSGENLALIAPVTRGMGDSILVFNTQSFTRSELCRLSLGDLPHGCAAISYPAGQIVPARLANDSLGPQLEFVAVDVPPLGYRCYRVLPGQAVPAQTNLVSSENSIQNEFFKVEWDRVTADITHIWDKRSQRELLSGCGNVVVAMNETDPEMEGSIHLSGQQASSAGFRAAQIEISKDAISLRVKAIGPFQDCTLIRETILYNFFDRIDFITTIENFHGGDVLINVVFPLELDWQNAERVYETAFAATPRPEGHFAAQTWVDCSDGVHGVALFNYGTPGYWIRNGCMELSLLRSFANTTHYQKYGLLQGVPGYESSTQTELAREHGDHTYRYTLYPHDKDWQDAHLFEMGLSMNCPLVVAAPLDLLPETGETMSYLSAGPGFLLSAIKMAEDGFGLVVRDSRRPVSTTR